MTDVPPMKCRIRNDAGVTRVDVFADIGAGGWFSDGLSAADFAAQMMPLRGPLEVHLNSSGGDVGDGLAIMNTISQHKGPVKTVVDGIAASIASVIAQAGQERVMQPGAMMMIHPAWGQCTGDAADMTKMAEDLNKHSDNIANIYAGRSGKTADYWRSQMGSSPWYTAEEAVKAGLADRVGDRNAELPEGMDLAALGSVPGRIAARLREMPVASAERIQDASARHEPIKGTHTHPHPAYGSQGSDVMHSHEHTHNDDANHSHSHAADGDAGDHSGTHFHAADGDCPTCKGTGKIDEGHRQCPDCKGTGKAPADAQDHALTASEVRAIIREELAAADGKAAAHGHPGKQCWDPDNDGDCDLTPEGDTDHDYWTAGGKQLKSVPGKPVQSEDQALTADEIRAIFREELVAAEFTRIANADVDNSEWDASKAWHNGANADNPEAFYRGICAGEKTSGDPGTQAHWALPYKYTPSSAPNAAGVRNALARLDSTQDLKDPAASRAKLQKLMKQINPDYEPSSGSSDHDDNDFSDADLEQIRSALKGAFAA